MAGFSLEGGKAPLPDLAFLVHDVLTDDGIELLDLHLAGHVALVFGGRVEMTGSRAGNQANFVTCCLGHGNFPRLDLDAPLTHISEHGIDTFLVDQAHGVGAQAQTDPALFALDPETMVMEIRQEPTLGFVVGMGDVATDQRALSGYLADFGHDASL